MDISDIYDSDDITPKKVSKDSSDLSVIKNNNFTVLEINGKKYSFANPELIETMNKTINTLVERVKNLDTALTTLRAQDQQHMKRMRMLDSQINRKIDRE